MIWVDWVLAALVAVSILAGVWRGFTREVLSLGTWILAIGAALLFAPGAADALESQIETPSVRLATAYGLLFFGGLVIGAVLTAVLASLVRRSPLSGPDRVLGGGFGLLRGVVLAVLLVWGVGMTPVRDDPWWGASWTIGHLERAAAWLDGAVPEEWRDRLDDVPREAVAAGAA